MKRLRRAWVVSWVVLGAGCAAGASSGRADDAERIREVERENASLRERVKAQERANVKQPGLLVPFRAGDSEILARVVDCQNPLQVVLLDKGKRNSVEVGFVFVAYRDSRYVARVQVTATQDETSSAVILEQATPIAAGDYAALECRCKPPSVVISCVFPPRIDATVLDVDASSKLVVLDKGKQDAVEIGYIFYVYRGATYKCAVRATEVREHTSTGVILGEKYPIAAGDCASTQL